MKTATSSWAMAARSCHRGKRFPEAPEAKVLPRGFLRLSVATRPAARSGEPLLAALAGGRSSPDGAAIAPDGGATRNVNDDGIGGNASKPANADCARLKLQRAA